MAQLATAQATDRQRGSISVGVIPQLPGLAVGPTRKPTTVRPELIAACKNRLDAIILCIQLSRLSQGEVAKRLGLDKGHLTRILQGLAYFPDQKSVELMEVCGNYAPLQYEAAACGFQLFKDARAQRKAELEAELIAINQQEIGAYAAA
jgi:transcriptional regulator with XRE-family HTH domain